MIGAARLSKEFAGLRCKLKHMVFCDGIEACEWIHAVVFEIDNYDVPVCDILQHPDRRRCVWYSDANALTSHCKKDCGLVANKQLRVVIASIREALQDKLNALWWCDTSVQLADGLTKLEAERGYIRAQKILKSPF